MTSVEPADRSIQPAERRSMLVNLLRGLLAIAGALHIIGWTGFAIAVSNAAVYSFYDDVWGVWLIFGIPQAVFALLAAWRTSHRAAVAYSIAGVVGTFGLFGALSGFAAMDPPDWAWLYQGIPLTTLAGVFLGPVAAGRFPSRPLARYL